MIRLAEPADLSRIMSFDSLTGDRISEIMERRMLVADHGGVKAYLSWQRSGCIGKDYVNKVVVEAGCRGGGLAKALVAALPQWLSGRVYISARAENTPALNLFRATGWIYAGDIAGLYQDVAKECFFYRDV